jgi:imidazole glycerol-phosphate synthase subunit HisH
VTIAVLDYGMGNLRSVQRALDHVGGDAEVTDDPDVVAAAGALVIPGVGHFGACVRGLRSTGLDRAVVAFAGTGRPLFGVCLGMQVLFEASDEDPAPGLGLLAGRVRALPSDVRVPHMGWNTVEWVRHPYVAGIADGEWFCFVHSYAADVSNTTIGSTTYGLTFSAAVASGNVFATQFHPEKSGDAGLQIYENFVKAVTSA